MKRYRFKQRNPTFERYKYYGMLFLLWNIAGFGILKFVTTSSRPNRKDEGIFDLPKEGLLNVRHSEEGIRLVSIKGFTKVKDEDFSSAEELQAALQRKKQGGTEELESANRKK